MTAQGFADFLRRIRGGDEDAAAELVRQYEPLLRREIRMRLTDPTLHRLVGASDICQAVFLSFFVRAAAGQYDLRRPQDLVRLLVRMARNKVAGQARRVRGRPADRQREPGGDVEGLELPEPAPPPPRAVLAADLLREVLRRLPAEERRLAELRARGLTWPQVSAELGGGAEARRKQLARALDGVVEQLGLQDDLWND
jgi:RNA polymerase sigma-70 factor (ECF subfamily)